MSTKQPDSTNTPTHRHRRKGRTTPRQVTRRRSATQKQPQHTSNRHHTEHTEGLGDTHGGPPNPPTRHGTSPTTTTTWAPTAEAVFLTAVPLLRHTPARTRKQLADTWAKEWYNFKDARTERDKVATLLRIFAFPKCILLSLPKQRHRSADPNIRSARQTIRDRLETWKKGEVRQLWHIVTQRARRSNNKRHNGPPSRQQNLERAKRLAQEGALAKAIRALGASGTHKPTPEIQRAIEAKHPQMTLPSDGAHTIPKPNETLAPIPRHQPFSPEELLRAIKRFPRGSSGGVSGLTPTHLLELCQSTAADRSGGILNAMNQGLDILAQGRGPTALAQWIAGAPLTAQRKEDAGVRPIAVGETVRRLISSMLLSRNSKQAQRLLCPLQVGVATSDVCESIVHATRELAHRYGHDNRLGLLQLDLANAFNRISRAAFRAEVRQHIPGLHAWTQYFYGHNTNPELWIVDGAHQRDHYRLKSVCGVQQGDPLGPLLFTQALRPILQQVHDKMGTWRAQTPPSETSGSTSPSLMT